MFLLHHESDRLGRRGGERGKVEGWKRGGWKEKSRRGNCRKGGWVKEGRMQAGRKNSLGKYRRDGQVVNKRGNSK